MEKLVYGGQGLARWQGKVVLAPFVLPGERARVAPERETASLIHARLVEVLEPAAERVAPECPHFMRCGGCHYQHAGYEFQLAQKQAVLAEVFRRVAKTEISGIGVVAGPPFGYRNRTQWRIAGGRIGYHQAGSHRLCPIERCPISSPKLNEALAALRRMIRQPRFPQFIRSLEIFTDEEQVQINIRETAGQRVARTFFEWCAAQIPGRHVAALDYAAAGETFRVSPQAFFQTNRFLIDRLVETALEGAEGRFAVDLYAGVGLFSLPLARRFARVEAVESARSAARDLEFNAGRAGLEVTVRQESAARYLAGLPEAPDFVLADPPRAGLGRGVAEQLVRLKPPRLVIVSCDPATLARDVQALLATSYAIERIALVDLFPQTYHIETVAHLRLR